MSGIDFSVQNKLTSMVRERRDALTVRWLISTAIIGGYAIVLAVLAKSRPVPVPIWLVAACWALAVLFAVASFVLPRRQLTDQHILTQLQRPIALEQWARRLKLTQPQQHELAGLPPAEQSLFGLSLLYQRPYMISLALSGGIGLCALGYGLAAKTILEAAPLLLAALAVNCGHYPRALAGLIERGRKLTAVDDNDVALQALKDLTAAPGQPADQTAAPPAAAAQAAGPHARKSAVTEPNTAPLRPRRQTLGTTGAKPRPDSGPLGAQRPVRPDSGPLHPRSPKLTPSTPMKRVDPGAQPPPRSPKLTPAQPMKRVEPEPSGPLAPHPQRPGSDKR